MNVILIAVIVLAVLGFVLAGALYIMSKKFAVDEDPRIGQVAEVLPGANCGGCGFPGCGGMAAACVKAADAGSIEGLNCPVGGQETMNKIGEILGVEVGEAAAQIAVVRCNGTCENRPKTVIYDGVKSCRIANTTCMGETACAYGCLGCGDCVPVCSNDAIRINPETGIVEIDPEKCGGCGACARACPRGIIEVRLVNGANKDAYVVECVNKDKGAQAMKACAVSCIACKKCENACGSDAIHVEGNVAHINAEACTLCGQCFDACPRGTIATLSIKGVEHKKVEKAAPKAAPAAGAATAAPKAPSKEWKAIDIKFDAPLLPSQQVLLAGPKDISNPVPAGKDVEFEAKRTDAPLIPSQMILLGLK